MARLFTIVILGLSLFGISLQASQQDKVIDSKSLEIVNLKFEVDAFEFLRSLGLKKGQLKQLKDLVKTFAIQPLVLPVDSPPKYTADYLEKLKALRDAYVSNDMEKIDYAKEEVEKILEKGNVEVDYENPVSDVAMTNAKKIFSMLKVYQIAGLIGGCLSEDYEGPAEKMMQAVDTLPSLNKEEKEEFSELVVESVVNSVAGIDLQKRDKLKDQVKSFLKEIEMFIPPIGKDQRDSFRVKALKIRGPLTVMDLLKNAAEFELAKQLSNPQFAIAVLKFKID